MSQFASAFSIFVVNFNDKMIKKSDPLFSDKADKKAFNNCNLYAHYNVQML